MSDLFSDAASQRAGAIAPLPQRLRPRTLDDFVGQKQVLGEGSALRRAIEEDRVRSAVFYGPPGAAELGVSVDDAARDLVIERSGGDARSALNIIEAAAETSDGTVTAEHVEDAARKRPIRYDKASDAHYDYISAFIKSIRGSDPD